MRMPPLPPRRAWTRVGPGERVLAWATVIDGGATPDPVPPTVAGTRDALHLPGDPPRRVAWESIASADWDAEESRLRLVEAADFGEVQPVHELRLTGADRLLQLVRERVSASIALQRHVVVDGPGGRASVRVIARRAPSGRGAVAWFVDYDRGLDPDDPAVTAIVGAALAEARADLGEA